MTTAPSDPPARPRPLLGDVLPEPALTDAEWAALARLQEAIDDEIAPLAVEHDSAGRYPTKAVAALKRCGVLHGAVPSDVGGPGFGHTFSLEVQVRLAAADSAVAQVYKIHDELTREILVYAPPERRAEIARRILGDDIILGLAVAEAGRRVDDPLTTVCTRVDDGWRIDGTKIYTTGAAEADWIALWTFDPEAASEENPLTGMKQFLVPPDHPGVTVHRDWDALGQRATDSGTITFADVRLPESARSSVPGAAPLPHASVRYQAGFAAVLVGIGVGALAAATPFVRERSRPWPSADVASAADDPMVQRLMGELAADLAAAYTLTLATGPILDRHDRPDMWFPRAPYAMPISAAKASASRAAMRATSEVFALMGTRSVQRSNGFDRWWRNARTLSLHDPLDWKQAEIGRHVLTGWDPPPGIYQ
ncbi:MAG: acyl-CoA dehydrogenase family protein [Ilumatobacteraceae bacterium]|nr:acyl-CoA dehydrogenase family protein [Ilumatobacteraceae bacterium]